MIFKKKIIPYGKQSITVRDIFAVLNVLRSPFLTQGPKIKEFENALCAYTGARFAVVVANGSLALDLAVGALELEAGFEGITSPNTFVASANCILRNGGVIKFADIESGTANMNPESLAASISTKTKVVIPVHFAGQSCDMERIQKIAKASNSFVIEDAAHAIGSEYLGQKVGSCKYSDMTIFSFHPVKNMTTGEGGAIMTNNQKLYEKLLMLRTIGITKDPQLLQQNVGPWYYEMQRLSTNCRMTDMQAALGISQLKRLNFFAEERRKIVALYRQLFAEDERFILLEERPYSKAAFHLCPILIDFTKISLSKADLFRTLATHGIMVQVHYIPVHTQPYYQNLGFNWGDFPIAEKYYQKALSLPVYVGLSVKQINRIVLLIKSLVK